MMLSGQQDYPYKVSDKDTGLAFLSLATAYRTGQSDPITEFYIPCMQKAVKYDRAVGFFRSSIYLIIGATIIDYAKRGGKIRLVCSPSLYEEDIKTIESSYEKRQTQLSAAITLEIEQMLTSPHEVYPTKVLATLILVGALDIRLALRFRDQGIFHEKIGIFRDRQKNAVSFIGSANETRNAWHEFGNFESIEVFCSWRDDHEQERVKRHEAYFEQLWSGEVPGIRVVPFPEAAKEHLVKIAHSSLDDIDISPLMCSQKNRTPLHYQVSSLESWKLEGKRGILEHATGSGKTFTALLAIKKHIEKGCPTLLVVPSLLLLDQWEKDIRNEFPEVVLMLCGTGHNSWKKRGRLKSMTANDARLGPRIVLAMMQTAADVRFRSKISHGSHLMIVADEVHQVGSPFNSQICTINTGPRLGLSATPRRYGDPEGTEKLFSYFGKVLKPVVTLSDAIKAGRLVQYEYHPHPIHLTAEEAQDWKYYSALIRKEIARSKEDDNGQKIISAKAKMMLIQRSRIAKKATNKLPLAIRLLKDTYQEGQRWLIYCEDVNQLREVMGGLVENDFRPIEYHIGVMENRRATLDWFKVHGGILTSIKCLDEGVDIPTVDNALILASSQNPRQFIQRRGRVLRHAEGKSLAVIHDTIVVPVSLEDEPEQFALLKSELLRAIEFANSALNNSAGAELREIAIRLGLDPESLIEEGIEEEDQ